MSRHHHQVPPTVPATRRWRLGTAGAVVAVALFGAGTALGAAQPSPGHRAPAPVGSGPTRAARLSQTRDDPAVPGCRPADLDASPGYEYGGAAGRQYQTVVVHSDAAGPCLLGGYPRLLYTDPDGGTVTAIPDLVDDGDDAGPVLLAPDGYARFTVAEANGPMLATPDPDCVPRDYHGVSVLLAGEPYPLPALILAWYCRPGTIGPWTAVDGAAG